MHLIEQKPQRGDRVKAVATIGFLELDTVGLVIGVYEPGEEGAYFEDCTTFDVAWPTLTNSAEDGWDGVIELPDGPASIDIRQFRGAPVVPMQSIEIAHVDNLLKKD